MGNGTNAKSSFRLVPEACLESIKPNLVTRYSVDRVTPMRAARQVFRTFTLGLSRVSYAVDDPDEFGPYGGRPLPRLPGFRGNTPSRDFLKKACIANGPSFIERTDLSKPVL